MWFLAAAGGAEAWSDMESDTGGERARWLPKGWPELDGEFACDGGVGRLLGDRTDAGCGGVDIWVAPTFVSSLGPTLEVDFRDWWCRFMMARWIGGGCTRGWVTCVGPRFGLVVLAQSSAWTSMPGRVLVKRAMDEEGRGTRTLLEEDALEERVLVA